MVLDRQIMFSGDNENPNLAPQENILQKHSKAIKNKMFQKGHGV
jgi:hypothetical protein